MAVKPKALNQLKKHLFHKLVLVALVVFFIYFLSRPTQIAPSFLRNIVSLDTLTTIVLPISLLSLLVILLSLIYLFVWGVKHRKTKRNTKDNKGAFVFLKIAIWVLSAIAVDLFVSDLTTLTARDKVKSYLNELSSDVKVSVNGQLVENPNEVITELRKVAPLTAHGSHDTIRVPIEITDHNETLLIELGRDSTNVQEYWVFYPKHRYTSKNEIGRIITDIFDDY